MAVEARPSSEEILLRLYEEDKTYARFHEQMRANLTNLVFVIGIATTGLVTYDASLTGTDLIVSCFLILIGLYGSVIGYKHYERCRLHIHRSNNALEQLNALVTDADLERPKHHSYEQNAQQFPRFFKLRLNGLWVAIPAFISLLGVVLALLIIFSLLTPGAS